MDFLLGLDPSPSRRRSTTDFDSRPNFLLRTRSVWPVREIEIHGDADEGFGRAVDEFRLNFERHAEVGAAFAVYRDGRPLVDVWAGIRDTEHRRQWERDTMVPVFSTSKGMSALAVAVAVSQGILGYDDRVSTHWPEFAQSGKAHITVRQLLDHQAGLPVIDTPLRVRDLADLDALAVVLARQVPRWRPGSKQGYHAISLGHFLNELMRRADPKGRTIGQLLADEVIGPLGEDFYIGLPDEIEMDRVARLESTAPDVLLRNLGDVPWRMGADFAVHRLARQRRLSVESLVNPNIGDPVRAARREFLRVEVPSSNGVGTARAIAHAYSTAVSDTAGLMSEAVRAELAAEGSGTRGDLVLHVPSRYHLGFRRPTKSFRFGSPSDRAFGTTGLGGSFGFADPDTGLAFGYVMNRLGVAIIDEPRNRRIREAVFAG
jgi:CubicO group peptidase (beta-lactamase class C family)